MTTLEKYPRPVGRQLVAASLCLCALTVAVLSAPAGIDDLQGVQNDRGVFLSWSVPRPEVRGFRIERQSGDELFETVENFIPAELLRAGSGQSYTFLDPSAPIADCVYRVTAIHKDGDQSVSGDVFVPAPAPAPAFTPQSSGQPGERVRIVITEDGLYYLDAARIADSLLGLSEPLVQQLIEGTNIAMSCQGGEVAWFTDASYSGVYFYGAATNNRFTSENIYWLAPGTGLPMVETSGPGPAPNMAGQAYLGVDAYEQNNFEGAYLYTNVEEEVWLWDYFFGTGTKTFNFNLNNLATNPVTGLATGRLHVALIGGSALAAHDPEHSNAIFLNDELIVSNRWDDHDQWVPDVPVTNLQNGVNALRLEALNLPAVQAAGDWAYHMFDSYQVSFPRHYMAVSEELNALALSNETVTVTSFSTGTVHVLDVVDFRQPVYRQDVTVDATGGQYRASFTVETGRRYQVSSALGVKTPFQVTGRSPMNLRSPTNRADHLTIAAPGLESAAEALAAHRRSQGLDALVVPVSDVFDRFSDGLFTPWAIRSFLQYAVTNWADPPRYVVLAGSGSSDYQSHAGNSDCVVPAGSAAAGSYGLRNSDAPLSDLGGGLAPELAIGRFHCQTLEEFEGAVAKVIAYESGGPWRGMVQFNAGLTDPGAGNFTNTCNLVAQSVSTNFMVDKNYIVPPGHPIAVAKQDLISTLNTGAQVVAYYGHGNPDLLGYTGDDTYLAKGDRGSITNTTQPTLMLAMTCDFADFGVTGVWRLGEDLVASDTGLAGLWGCTGPTFNDLSEALGKGLCEQVFGRHAVRIGDAIVEAAKEYEEDERAPYVLGIMAYLGDPAMLLPEPGVLYSYDAWRNSHFTTNATNPVVAGMDADPEGDGVVNQLEFLWDLDPASTDAPPEFAAELVTVYEAPDTNDYATLTFPRRRYMEGMELRVERTFDLMDGSWTNGPTVSQEMSWHNIDDVLEEVTVRVYPPLVSQMMLFVRMVLEHID